MHNTTIFNQNLNCHSISDIAQDTSAEHRRRGNNITGLAHLAALYVHGALEDKQALRRRHDASIIKGARRYIFSVPVVCLKDDPMKYNPKFGFLQGAHQR